MISVFDPQFQILVAAQQEIWPELAPATNLGFVLYGGTAIALQLGHRQSIDFDFFPKRKLDKDLLRSTFSFFTNATLLQDRQETLTIALPFQNSIPVKISFLGNFSFGGVGEPQESRDGVLQVASLDDLMATKLKAIFQRIESKDYIDIAAMIQVGVLLA